MLLSSYSVNNLIHASESLLEITRTLNVEVASLQRLKDDVMQEQQEAHKQGQLVKKMTNYLSNELGRLELDTDKIDSPSFSINSDMEKFSETETKLRVLRGRLSEFVDEDDTENLKKADSTISDDLKGFESFLLDLTSLLNQRIPNLEKVIDRLRGESREAQQQKVLLKEMVALFNKEIEELDSTFTDLKNKLTVS
jgi:predicted  nucleic acid-binding Zn-ribbon protein